MLAPRLRQGHERRPHATHVDALLGDFHQDLPPARFDLVFSISALEHSDPADAPRVCEDLFRITAPGGLTVHTIDTPVNKPELRFDPWLEAFRASGFVPLEPAMMSNGLHGLRQAALLLEPLETRLRYFRDKDEFWTDPPVMRDQIGTIMVAVRKPGKLRRRPPVAEPPPRPEAPVEPDEPAAEPQPEESELEREAAEREAVEADVPEPEVVQPKRGEPPEGPPGFEPGTNEL